MTNDPLVDWLQGAMSAMSRQSARLQGIQTLGDFYEVLQKVPGNTPVVTDEAFESPVELCSYRGYYERLGISTQSWSDEPYTETTRLDGGDPFELNMSGYGTYTPGASEVQIKQPCTAADMMLALELCDGVAFEGYKGGQFVMDKDTYLHVAPNGSTGRMVVGFTVNEAHGLVIVTDEEKY